MNNRILEERQEREQAAAVAAELEISVADLDKLNWRIEPHESDDGILYGHNVYFEEGSDPEVLSRIAGLHDGRWVRIRPDI